MKPENTDTDVFADMALEGLENAEDENPVQNSDSDGDEPEVATESDIEKDAGDSIDPEAEPDTDGTKDDFETDDDSDDEEKDSPEDTELSDDDVVTDDKDTTDEEEPLVQPEPPTFEAVQEALSQSRDSVIAGLEERYAMTEEEAGSLIDNPQEVLPKLAAAIVYDTYTSLWATVVSQFPSLIDQTNTVKSKFKGYEDAFFEAWPALKDEREVVGRVAANYRRQNPNATPEQAIKEVGQLSLLATGKLQSMVQGNSEGNPPPKKDTPARPLGKGRVTTPPKRDPNAGNIFSEMAEIEED